MRALEIWIFGTLPTAIPTSDVLLLRQCAGNFCESKGRLITGSVPNVKYLNTARRLGKIIKDAVGTENDFTQRAVSSAWVSGTDGWKVRKNLNVIEDALAYSVRCLWVMNGDVGANVLEINNCSIRPDYFEVHAVAHDSTIFPTSSWLFDRPAAMSARPRRMDAMIRSSSEISSREADSGSLLRASITASLSVMWKP